MKGTHMESRNQVVLAGTLVEAKAEETKNGKEVMRLVIETDPPAWMTNVTQKDRTQVSVFGRTVSEAKKLRAGQFVAVSGRARGREYNGKWYCDIIGEQFKVLGATAAPKGAAAVEDDVAF